MFQVASTPINFLVNLVAGLIASCYQPKKPSLGCNCSLCRGSA